MEINNLTMQMKIKIAAEKGNVTQTKMAEALGISKQAFFQRLKNERISDEEMQILADVIGCKYHRVSEFIFDDGSKLSF